MIRFFIILLLILLPINVLAKIGYQLDVQLFPEEQRLVATAVISPGELQQLKLELQLADNCELIDVHQAGFELDHSFNNGRLVVELINQQPLSISYRGHFTDQVSGTPVHNEDPSYGVAAGISSIGTFLSAAAGWYPRLDSQDIHYRLKVMTPLNVEAISSGQRTERYNSDNLTYSTWEVDYPISGLTLSAGPYRIFEDLNGEIPIYAYFYPASEKLAPLYLREARNYLNLYQELFGPYPFHKFAIVENFFPTGYGFPSWTLLGSSVIRLPFIVKTSLGHEMAHSWWGTGVRVDYRQGNWSEGLTSYVADHLYKERSSEAESREYRLNILRDYAELVDSKNSFPLASFLSRTDKASLAIGYGKAAMLFHMLRKQLGDELFWTVLRKIATEKMFQQIAWSDFAAQFSAAAGRDLTTFFEQWLKRNSGPNFSLRDVVAEKTTEGYQLRGLLEQSAPCYQLMVDLQVTTETGPELYPVNVDKCSQEFLLDLTEPPRTLTADPNADLFRILANEETPPTTNSVRGSTDLRVLKANKHTPSSAATRALLMALRKGDLSIESLAEITAEELAGHDLLIFGVDDNLKPGILSAEKITLAGTATEIAGKSAFVVLPHPTTENRIAAWFISADNSNDATVARKIAHYGKYSYLLFEGTNNRIKGTFEPKSSPMKIDFVNPAD